MVERDLVPVELEPVAPRVDDHHVVLAVEDLAVEFTTDEGVVRAVDGVSFDVRRNEVLGVVGESGSGKTVTALAILGLLPRGARVRGEVRFQGENIAGAPLRRLEEIRGEGIAIVFQDALAALNPVHTVGAQIAEAIRVHHELAKNELRDRMVGLLDLVGIPEPRRRADQYPHEFSGGMRQRAMIAMAIANDPAVLIADEPTTALDVTIQAQVLDVLERIQDRTDSAIMLITHDLGVVAGMADHVMVMYAGRQAEVGTVEEIFYERRHPYTLGLLASLPRIDRGEGEPLFHIAGQPPSLIHVPPGCPFHPRCFHAHLPEPCATERPALRRIAEGDHRAACHFAEEMADVTPEGLRAEVRS
jgi:oligopeptide/dipeptide ABC transporter ATP-binding protein